MKRHTLIIITLLIVFAAVLFFIFEQKTPQATITNDFLQVPQDSQLLANMSAAGLDTLSSEGAVLHTHQHLDILINGKQITIPAEIGIGTNFFSPIHTHDETGVIHVESPVVKDFTLGQFFEEWGINLSDACVGNFCADANNKLIAAVNGVPITQPQNYILKQHDEIEIWYGPKNQLPTLISSYNFAPGL